MTSITLILFFLILCTNFPTYIKLIRKRDLNAFDLMLIFQSLYFFLIPIKGIVEDVLYRNVPFKDIVNEHPLTLIYFFVFSLGLAIINQFWTKYCSTRKSIINLTTYIHRLDDKIIIDKAMIYLAILVFILCLYPIVNYSSLNEDNLEGNLTYRYALDMPLYQRMLVSTISSTFPVFVLFVIKFLYSCNIKRDKNIAYVALAIAAICALLGTRTLLIFVIIVIILYIYSVKREAFTLKRTVVAIIIMGLITSVIFPLSLAFRQTKQEAVKNSANHSFSEVSSMFISMSSDEKSELLKETLANTKQRSLNVYMALDETCYKDYESTNGALIIDQIKTIIPTNKPAEEYANILGDRIEGQGNDIGESLSTYFIFDLGVAGILVACLYSFLFFYVLKLVNNFFYFVFKDSRTNFICIIYILDYCYTVESVPLIRVIYNPDVIVYFTFALTLYVFDYIKVKKVKFN